MRTLKARYASGTKFLESYDPRFPHGGLRLRVRDAVVEGEAVLLQVRFPELRDHLLIRGHIAWCRRDRGARIPDVGVAFLPEETVRRDHLVAVASGSLARAAGQRRYLRVPVDVPVTWEVDGEIVRREAALVDIGAGGAYVRCAGGVPTGTDVVLHVLAPGAVAPLDIAGTVVWAPSTGQGFGVEFRWRDTGGIRRLREVVRRLGAPTEEPAAAI